MRPPAPGAIGFHLARGGPFYLLLRRIGLARDDEHDVRRQAVVLVALSWLPLAAIAAAEGLLGMPVARLVRDPSLHARFLVALPLLLVAEHVLDHRCRLTLDRVVTGRFTADDAPVRRIAGSAARLRDSFWAEMLLLVVALLLSQRSLWEDTRSPGLFGSEGVGEEVSAARVWCALVGLPLFQFLLARTAWRWFIWSRLLWQLSRLRLQLVPTHPDLAGGVAILYQPVVGIAFAILGGSAVIAGAWIGQVLAGRATLTSFATPFVLLVVLAEVVALGPLLFFARQLFDARYQGLRQYGALALRYTRAFHRRWVEPPEAREPQEDEILGTPDLQSLADLANSYQIVQGMRMVPFGMRAVYRVFLAAVLPMVPLLLTEKSIWEVMGMIGRALLGGRPV